MKKKSGKAPVKTRAAAAGVDKSMEISLAKISATFGRLRDDSIAAEHKVEDVNYACNAIRRFQEATAQLSDSIKLSGSIIDLQKSVASEATQVIHMMQKFFQVDHTAAKVPFVAGSRASPTASYSNSYRPTSSRIMRLW
ncbi:hypothetical protein L917_08645 [Phytophthora nicotianae]|uniref:Uncharacterized protein n=1 Tax=Phytophthora nicotianae TaxID=4792 RepID=W2L6U8_PHYNI|nr:hypothetical protein L917_08645 [Phytophthora nicotianae]